MSKIEISVADVTVMAQLNDTETAQQVLAALPLQGQAQVWGEEIYFDNPVRIAQAEDAIEKVSKGDLGYWPQGPAFCIFFGPTPVSTDAQPRAYSPVNVFGRIMGDTAGLKTVTSGALVQVSAV